MKVADLHATLRIDTVFAGDPKILAYLQADRDRRFRYFLLASAWLAVVLWMIAS